MTDKQTTKLDDKNIFTTKEVAEILGVTEYTVRETYIQSGNGLLKAFKPGDNNIRSRKRPWRIWKKDLMEFINRGSNIKENK